MPEFRDVIPGSQVSVSRPSVAGLQAALAAGTLSSAALTGFYLQRIERLNPALHAVITVNPDAQAAAVASDAARAADGPRGPLEGIPVLVKDNIQVAGMPTTAGSPGPPSAQPRRAFLGLPPRPARAGAFPSHRYGTGRGGWQRAWRTRRPCSPCSPRPTPRTRSRPPRMNWPNGPGFTRPVPLTRKPWTQPRSRVPAWASGGTARR